MSEKYIHAVNCCIGPVTEYVGRSPEQYTLIIYLFCCRKAVNDSLRSIPTIPIATTVTNLLIAIKDTFSRKLIIHIAAWLGEAESGINRALNGNVPVVLGGLISQTKAGDSQAVHSLEPRCVPRRPK